MKACGVKEAQAILHAIFSRLKKVDYTEKGRREHLQKKVFSGGILRQNAVIPKKGKAISIIIERKSRS